MSQCNAEMIPPWDQYTNEDYGCRCIVQPMFADKLESKQVIAMTEQILGWLRGREILRQPRQNVPYL